ncbi:hypothetical protein HDV03_001550 [Kappamyces sp. JEL0829]|nr:hypothetical protein HDV03_001550 [Kappamyces sp. JEL0829]
MKTETNMFVLLVITGFIEFLLLVLLTFSFLNGAFSGGFSLYKTLSYYDIFLYLENYFMIVFVCGWQFYREKWAIAVKVGLCLVFLICGTVTILPYLMYTMYIADGDWTLFWTGVKGHDSGLVEAPLPVAKP